MGGKGCECDHVRVDHTVLEKGKYKTGSHILWTRRFRGLEHHLRKLGQVISIIVRERVTPRRYELNMACNQHIKCQVTEMSLII